MTKKEYVRIAAALNTNTAQHTSGPWRIEDFGQCRNDEYRGYGQGQYSIPKWNCAGWARFIRLIAAAPEMLQSLYAIVNASDGCRGHADCEHDMIPWKTARALLARIEGEGG